MDCKEHAQQADCNTYYNFLKISTGLKVEIIYYLNNQFYVRCPCRTAQENTNIKQHEKQFSEVRKMQQKPSKIEKNNSLTKYNAH